jgi:hypothetical protein
MAFWSGYPPLIGVVGGFLAPWSHSFLQLGMEAKGMIKVMNINSKEEKTARLARYDNRDSNTPRSFKRRNNPQDQPQVNADERKRRTGRGKQLPTSPGSDDFPSFSLLPPSPRTK